MKFKLIADYFDKLEKISSRIQLTSLLANLISETDPSVVDKVVYIIQGKLWPEFLGMPEIGLGEKLLIKAISLATGISEQTVEDSLKSLGDLGEVALKIKQKVQSTGLSSFLGIQNKVEELSVEEVYEALSKIALSTGQGSRDMKLRLMAGVLKKASPLESKFIVRFVEGKLRVGIGDATIMDALALAYTGSDENRQLIERAYNLRADLGNVAKLLVTQGIESLKSVRPQPGIPIRPMLAERLSDPAEILQKVGGKALVDYKYDGERGQIHKKGKDVYIFSRRMENITSQYPDVVKLVEDHVNAQEVILEGEIVAIDPDTGEMRPFQELMHRKRKVDIQNAMREYPVRLYLFDLMYLDGEDFTTKDQLSRRETLKRIVDSTEEITVANAIIASSVGELEDFFFQAISEGAEGVMVKSIAEGSIYQAGARGWLWIKFKRDYRSEMADTVDLVAVGALYGRGRRGGKLSSLLMAAYDPRSDTFQTVCKVATGFSDQDLEELQRRVKEHARDVRHPRVVSVIEPDLWLEPAIVCEIIGSELTLSPSHVCCKGMVREGVGISIRFPRFIRWRDDKSPEDATTAQEILEMYKRQLKKIEERSEQQ
jgi:DNA ligase-1